MKSFTYVITDPQGVHARPATELVQAAAKLQSAVTLKVGERSVSAKSIFAIMSLNIKKDTEIELILEGADECEGAKALEDILKANL
ncbi:HPr family phosphocarrier protein [Gehongia tenuis]|uniref:Phosphocarrier protein HPr n=1 Tax=Gehongia tenuis TaxID=2763655 RepID=A0A926HQ77_9FIRM|nr:HPr family phosphocarrier protein [Gehongia tenuis]MBC8530961.1 HPr family phosphocarrier protein [Gehongia tenuis]